MGSYTPTPSITCTGTPYEIGHAHGSQGASLVHGSIKFYTAMFQRAAHLSWPEVTSAAEKFLPALMEEPEHRDLLFEMRGLADGAGVPFNSILALNVRTEIAYGMVADGCTAFSWLDMSKGASFLAQNWDWETEQSPNIIRCHITPADGGPRMAMMTEAGIIGKIGINSAGVGVTLNAIKARGVDFARLPCHLALRTVLNSTSREEARGRLVKAGVASACHITVADETGGVGLECSAADVVETGMRDGVCTHSNHFVEGHKGIVGKVLLADSLVRLERIRELIKGKREAGPNWEICAELLRDEKDAPEAICRTASGTRKLQTLFSIVMDLVGKRARVKMGKPVLDGEEFELVP